MNLLLNDKEKDSSNKGYIKISDHGEFTINTGATFDYQYGTLDITQ